MKNVSILALLMEAKTVGDPIKVVLKHGPSTGHTGKIVERGEGMNVLAFGTGKGQRLHFADDEVAYIVECA